MTSILFLCTGNSCRSQVAEGWANSMRVFSQVDSAGIETHGLNPKAVTVMAEMGIDISVQESKEVTEFDLDSYDLVVIVCGDADERCPMFESAKQLHWQLEDPAKLADSETEIIRGFRATRDEIQALVRALALEK